MLNAAPHKRCLQAHERHREEERVAAAKPPQRQAAGPAIGDPAWQHTAGPAHGAHTNGVYRLAESPAAEVATGPEAGHGLRNGSGDSVNGASHGGVPGQRAATPNVSAHCCGRGPAAPQRRRRGLLSLARGGKRVSAQLPS